MVSQIWKFLKHFDFNAVRSGKFPFSEIEREVLPSLATLNGPTTEVVLFFDVHACTDITGFGIIGHALEMATGRGVQIFMQYKKLPFYSAALDMYKKGENTGSNKTNQKLVVTKLKLSLTSAEEELLYVSQTSGRILLSLPEKQADDFLAKLAGNRVARSVKIGQVEEAEAGVVVR